VTPGTLWSAPRWLAFLVLAFVLLAGSAMLRTSTTFDEMGFVASGARGLRSGDFSLVNDHPRLAQYLYGMPIYLSEVNYPPEEGRNWSRYYYAQALLWESGNRPERIAMSARLVGLAFGAFAVVATFLLARRHMEDGAALLAAGLLALMPDFIAHSGVAYNDVPLAFALLLAVYALDAMVRAPTPARGALAGLACALVACIKYSGLVVVPILAALLALEALSGRWRARDWWVGLVRSGSSFVLAGYGAIVVIYLGDWRLEEFRAGLAALEQATSTGRVAFLLGERNLSGSGWWYFFPVALALKTPVALHVLALVALGAAVVAARGAHWREWLVHGARAPAAAAAIFLAALMASRFNIGVRHALPLLPFACILVAHGVAAVWKAGATPLRWALGLTTAAFAASGLAQYPHFLSYLNAYAYGRTSAETLVDSNTDWGQGLVALGEFMRARGIESVALAYFGSALPEGYGIRYVPLPSFMPLRPQPPGAEPRYIVISATLLAGMYVRGDPYAHLRAHVPVAVLAGSLYVFDREAL